MFNHGGKKNNFHPVHLLVSMNKIKVGNAPPPNLREVRSKIGSLSNATHKPGGGNVKIENKKLEFNVQSRITAKNDNYTPGGGDKKVMNITIISGKHKSIIFLFPNAFQNVFHFQIISNKLQWSAKSKIGSLENASHKPGGGDKKILNFKADFGSAKSKVGSKETANDDEKST